MPSLIIYASTPTNGILIAPETAAPGDDLIIDSGATIQSFILAAGDDVIIHGTAEPFGAGDTISVTAGYQDMDGLGAITIDGTVSADNLTLAALTGMTLTGGTITAATLNVSVSGGGGISQSSGSITADRLLSTGGVVSDVSLLGVNNIATLGNFIVTSGDFTLVDNSPLLTIDATVAATGHNILIQDNNGITTTANSAISATTVALVANQLALDAGTITATDQILLLPAASGTAVALGDNLSAAFTLSQAKLDTLTAPTLTIGHHDAFGTAGPITIGDVIFTSSTLNLYSLGSVTGHGSILVGPGGTGTLNITAGGSVELTAPNGSVGAAAIGGSTTSGNFVVSLSGTNGITVHAITTAGGQIAVLQPHNGTMTVDGALTSNGGNILFSGNGALTLAADVNAGTGSIVPFIANNSTVTQTAGKLVGHDLLIAFTSSIDLDSADNAISGHVEFIAAKTGTEHVNFTNSVAYTIGGVKPIGTPIGTFTQFLWAIETGTLNLTAGGDITQGSGSFDSIVVETLNLAHLARANPNVTLDNALNNIFHLGTVDLGSGALTLVDGTGLVVDGTVTAGSLVISDSFGLLLQGGSITTTGAQSYHGPITLGAAATLSADTISFDQTLDTNGFDLTASLASASTFDHVMTGAGRFTKAGAGTLMLTALDSYTGATDVLAGTLLVDGSIASSTQTKVANGATLGGHGTVGDVVVQSGGTLAPGDSPGVLTTGSLVMTGGAHLSVELGGATPGLYDQLQVHGLVFLNGATLDGALVGGFMPTLGESFTIIDNDGNDPVLNQFAGLAEGATTIFGGVAFSISYHGGDGNDVTLTALANHAPVNTVPAAQTVTSDTDLAIGGLSVADQDAGSDSMTTTLTVTHGVLHAASGHASVAGDGTGSVTLSGSQSDINATLASLTYHSAAGFTGPDTLNVLTSDLGHNGVGGPLTDTDTMKINVTAPVAQPVQPIIGTPGDDSLTAPAGDSEFIGLGGTDTINFGFRLVDATVTYSGNQIIIDGPNGSSHTVLNGIETFVFTDGTVNDRDGSPLIDDLFYYARNHDVWNAHVDADTHFNTFGWKEGRDPNAFFDTKGYLAHYTDVAAAGVNPLTHYDQFGFKEGRDPSTQFDTAAYLAHNPDVAAAHVDPLAHFLAWGAEEGRQPFNDGVFA
jgi:fibronectin-binding autotransporter adhesin